MFVSGCSLKVIIAALFTVVGLSVISASCRLSRSFIHSLLLLLLSLAFQSHLLRLPYLLSHVHFSASRSVISLSLVTSSSHRHHQPLTHSLQLFVAGFSSSQDIPQESHKSGCGQASELINFLLHCTNITACPTGGGNSSKSTVTKDSRNYGN